MSLITPLILIIHRTMVAYTEIKNNTNNTLKEQNNVDDEFHEELINTFIIEFEELLDIYKNALQQIRKPIGENKSAYKDIFRVYHTLKGDAGYFPEFADFAKFASHYCEQLRGVDDYVIKNQALLRELRLNYTRLSSAFKALTRGKSLQAFRFKLFLKNF